MELLNQQLKNVGISECTLFTYEGYTYMQKCLYTRWLIQCVCMYMYVYVLKIIVFSMILSIAVVELSWRVSCIASQSDEGVRQCHCIAESFAGTV